MTSVTRSPSITPSTAPSTTPATTAPTAVTTPTALRQPDLDQRSATQKVIGGSGPSVTPVKVQGDPTLKGQIDAARATGNPNPSAKSEWKQPFPTKTKYDIGPNLNEVRTGQTLARGQSGPGVEDLQRKLNGALKGTGLNSLDADGLFGPKTQANLRAYQESRGLPATGTLDQATMAALDRNTPARAGWKPDLAEAHSGGGAVNGGAATGVVSTVTANMTESQKFDHYKAMIERSGGRFNPNGPNIVGVRSDTNTNTNRGGGRYDDTMAVVWMENGQPRVREFRGNTEPAGNYRGRMGQDVNGDGVLDQGRLRTGHYEYQVSSYRGGPALRMAGDSVVDRDTNGDGVFGNDGGAASRGGASMLFHRGGSSTTGSAGCQTMPPAEFDRFMSTLRDAGLRGRVGYTLVNGG